MKVAAYEVFPFERKDFALAPEYGLQLVTTEKPLDESNVSLAEGCEAISVLGMSVLNADRLKRLKDYGVKYISTRTVGFDHIDLKAAKQLGLRVGNAQYQPYNVADFTVMLMLMLLRKAKVSVCRALVNDFSIDGMQGKELRSLTVGVVGAGKIGRTVMENLRGFGCKLLCYDPYVSPETLPKTVTPVPFDELLARSDIVTLHVPYTPESAHMIDGAAFGKMKQGALLINTARGGLVDTNALIEAIESGKLDGAALDAVEGEEGLCHVDQRTRIATERNLFYLKQFPNVIYTPHYAFFTEEATSSMVLSSLSCISLFGAGKENPYEVKI